MKKEKKERNYKIWAYVMFYVGLIGSIFALISISASESTFQVADQVFRIMRDFLRETDPDAVGALVRPTREYISPMSTMAIVTLSVLVTSVFLFFIGGGILITRFISKNKLERIQKSDISLLTFTSLCIALAVVLSQIRLFQMPQGGSITAFSMLPIVLVGYWYGAKSGISAGIVYGLLRLMLGSTVYHPIQFILDYPMAYAALGAFCMFRSKRFGLQASYIAGVAGRFLCSFIAGMVFFGEFAPVGQPVWIYSAVYQLTYIGPEAVVTLIVLSMPPVMNAIEQLRRLRVKGNS
ncbi:MAG: energy-coupled thiamine transporter ThiT [Oscillospiraceae bacterium]|jgi:thiamine transporter|nr:energy-coupled thiamine transporter ThiT [Oscillospiraceae bacterium]